MPGGSWVMKVNERSEKMVITTGMIIPGWFCVRALKALQNSIMLTPCWPSAGPTGGEGMAAPGRDLKFNHAYHFFRHRLLLARRPLILLHLDEVEFHRCRPAENGNENLELALFGLDPPRSCR